MKLVVYVLVILLMMFALGLLATAVGETPGAAPDFRIPACEKAKRARFEALRESRVGPPTADPRYHVEHYEIDIAVDFDSQTIAGDVSVAARSDRIGLEEIELDLHDNFTVSAVTRNGVPLAFTHGGHRLVVTLDRAFALSEPFTVRVVYDGPPAQDGLLSFTFDNHDGSPIAATVSEPWFARDWWPCRETPNAKSTASMTLTVPAGMTAVSNGRPVTTSRAGGTVAYRHESDYPIATYLVSAAITNFSAFSSTYTCLDGSQMPLEYYAYPEDLSRAESAWDIARPQMEYFRTLFGEYPFTDDRYGMVEIPFGGAMEHQTITSMGACCIESESTIAHELAHQWWGDYVTCATWHDIWLNEGFATWSAALWYGHTNPPDGYRQAMTNMDTGSFGSVYRYDISNPWLIFTGEAYRKGAWVLHMLRGVLGDETFFDGLDHYRATHAYGNATTEDLEAAFETVAGTELDWFFDEWVYGVGRPVYEWGWEASGGEVFVMLRQVQSGPLFRMPVEIEISTDSGSTRHIVWNELTTQYYSLPASGEVTSVVLDPDDWLLDQQMLVTVAVPGDLPTAPGAGRAHIERITPIPFADTVEIRITGFAEPSASRARSRLDVYDARGRRVATLMDEALSTGSRAIVWDGMTSRNEPAASGVYFLRLEAPGGQETRRLVRTR